MFFPLNGKNILFVHQIADPFDLHLVIFHFLPVGRP